MWSSRLKRAIRSIYRIGVLLLWVVLAATGLETCETVRAFVAERAYKDYFESQNSKVYGMVAAEDLESARNQFSLPEADRDWLSEQEYVPARANEKAKRSLVQPQEALQRERQAFAAQSIENRNVIATLEGRLVLTFSPSVELESSCGEPMLQQYLLPFLEDKTDKLLPPEWQEIFNAVQHADTPRAFRVQHIEQEWPCLLHHYDVTVAPQRDADGQVTQVEVNILDITDTLPLEERDHQPLPGDSSPWKLPAFSYKENWYVEGEMLSTNNFGFRDDDVVVPKPPGVFRIACVGGSTTEEGNSNDATYPNIMERKLREQLGTDAIDVVNCGLCAMTTYSERRRVYDYLDLEPDLLLFYVGVNDMCHKHFGPWLARAENWQKLLRRSRFLARWLNRRFLPPDEELADYIRATTFRNLKAIRYAARERGVDMALCSFACPKLGCLDFRARNYYDLNMREVWQGQGLINFRTYCNLMDLYNGLLKQLCEDEGMIYVPVAEHFHAGPDHFFDICHMTPLGLELKTNIIGAYMADYILRARQKATQ